MALTQLQNLRSRKQSRGLFLYIGCLTLIFVGLQVSYLYGLSGFYLGDIQSMARHLGVPHQVIVSTLIFIGIQFLLHVIFVFFIWLITQFIAVAINLSWKKTETLALYLWGLSVLMAIFGNQYYYPNAKFAGLTSHFVPYPIAGLLFYIGFSVFMVACVFAVMGAIKLFPKLILGLLLLFCFAVPCYDLFDHEPSLLAHDASTKDKPNIIIIGIDSLRPDFLGYFGNTENTPNLNNFLEQSTVFAEAMTPIARTFPSWVSILTGRYPKQSGARTNLENIHHIKNLNATLPSILRKHGYVTFFATDETRFSNIDAQYGFDKVVTPPIGFNDFLLGTINDFPFSNALINTSLGRSLFPNSFGSRPVAATYDPDSFLDMVDSSLPSARTQPLFLAIHFCLPHTPYYWGTALSTDQPFVNYHAAVQRVDQQFKDFVTILNRHHLLEHAIVVVLSDHGESIELLGDRITSPDLFVAGLTNKKHEIPKFYPPTVDNEPVDRAAGHGTDVLSLTQYHSVLAFRLFGMSSHQISSVLPGRVSLMDIKPTILSFLKMPFSDVAGISLKTRIMSKNQLIEKETDFFMESDFSPTAIRSVHPETRDVVMEGINYFQIDPVTARLTVKPSMEALIISSKQIADMYGEWILALYPQSNNTMIPILVNLKSGFWTNDLKSSFAAHSPATHMLQALHQFYGKEVRNIT